MQRNILFFCLLVLFLLHQLTERVLSIPVPWADNYLDALLFMPILLTLVLWERKWLWRKDASYTLPLKDAAGYCILVSLLAEWVFPALHQGFTGDWVDVFLYALGACTFLLLMNAPASAPLRSRTPLNGGGPCKAIAARGL